jgi:hypothetical protein
MTSAKFTRSKRCGAILVLLIIIVGTGLQPGTALASLPESQGATKVYNLKPYPEDQVLALPLNGTAYYFRLGDYHRLQDNNFYDIVYTHSATIQETESTLTVILNDIPLASRKMDLTNEEYVTWRVQLPKRYFKEGFNELKVMTNQRTITDGLCRDIDNPANWLVVSRDSVLHLEAAVPQKKILAYWPYPFIDTLEGSPLRFGISLRDDLLKIGLPAALTLAADLGRHAPQRDFSAVSFIDELNPGQAMSQIDFSSSLKKSDYPAGTGVVSLSQSNPVRMLISGKDSAGLQRGVSLLDDAETVSQLADTFFATSSGYQSQDVDQYKSKGYFTLADFASPGVNVSGAFHQMSTININRPAGWQVGDGSYIEFHFRHSAALKPERSMMSVYVNRIPAASVSLNASNQEKGILRIPIPADQLAKDWQVDIACYHDIGEADCSKRYEEVAWTYVEKSSLVYLATGNNTKPASLRAFPALNSVPGLPESPLTGIISDSASADIRQLLLTTAIRSGQNAEGRVVWETASLEDIASKETIPKGDLVVIASRQEYSQVPELFKGMPIKVDENGKYIIDSDLPIDAGHLQNGFILQAGVSPFDPAATAYLVIIDNQIELAKAVALIAKPELNQQLDGDVAVLRFDGALQTFQLQSRVGAGETGGTFLAGIVALLSGPSSVWRVYTLMVGLVVIGISVSILISRRRKIKK